MNNTKTVKDIINKISMKYLGVAATENKLAENDIVVNSKQLERALKEAFKSGEKAGYKCGFSDAKHACDCVLEDVTPVNSSIDNRMSLV